MGFIERRGKRYRARYRGPDGKERSRTFDRKVDADRFISVAEADKARGSWIDPALGRTTVEAWASQWLGSLVHLKPKTQAGYESLLRCHVLPRFGSTPLGRISRLDAQTWISKMEADGLSPSRIRQARQVLGALLTAAQRTGYIAKNVTDGIRLPREIPRKMRFLTAEQVESLVSHTPPSYQPLIYLLSYGGLRWGEAVALRLKNVRFERSRIDVHESMAEVSGRVYFGPTKTYEFQHGGIK